MKSATLRYLLAVISCLSFSHGSAFAQTSDHSQSLSVCINDLGICNYFILSGPEAFQVAAGEHQRNIADCRRGAASCDRTKLTPAENNALAVALHQHNVSDCMEGWEPCNHSMLTQG